MKPELGKTCTNPNFTQLGEKTDGFVSRILAAFDTVAGGLWLECGWVIVMINVINVYTAICVPKVLRLRHFGSGARGAHGTRTHLPAIEVLSLR